MKKAKILAAAAVSLSAAALVMTAGCASSNPYFDASKPHHTPAGFVNNYPPDPAYRRPEVGFVESWVGRIRNWTRDSDPQAPRRALDPVAPELSFLHANRDEPAVTWIGHATLLIQTGSGLNLLTDPVFEDRASPVSFAGPKRHQRPGLSLAQLPRIDAVLLSHGHYDHLSLASMRALYRQPGGPPQIYAPLGVDAWLARHVTDGDTSRITRMDWWDRARLGDTEIHLLPVQHWSARTPWDRNRMLWGAFAVVREGFSFFYSGDLGYSKDIGDIARRFSGFDLAAIGVGAYEPVWYRNSHVSPAEAVRIHRELKVRRSIGIHWGTFPMGQERLDQPIDDLAAARREAKVADEDFILLRHGETHRLGQREAREAAGSVVREETLLPAGLLR